MIDKSLDKTGDPASDYGVNPRLARAVRNALDDGWKELNLNGKENDIAREYYRSIRIVASGGFNAARIESFEKLGAPVDFYGVGSYFYSGETNDFTADIVRVNIEGDWTDLAKDGRRSIENAALKPVKLRDGNITEG